MLRVPSARSIEEGIGPYLEAGQLAGAAALIWRDGQIRQVAAMGRRDLDTALPVERSTIFRIASMTKPVTTVAALTMCDEGLFDLDEPIGKWAPEFGAMQVLRSPDGPLDQGDEAVRAITFRDLLTHRSGLTYGDFHAGPIGRAHAQSLGAQIDNPLTPEEWIARLAALPLIDQPGAGFHYGLSTDLLGFIIARIEGASLSTVLQRRVFAPLAMHDTGFTVPFAQRERQAGLCGFDDEGRLVALSETPGRHAQRERPEAMTFESGGQGLWSTLDDYLAFARMLVGDGAGSALLRPETRTMMTSNHLTAEQRATTRLMGQAIFATGHGYGMGVAVVMESDKADPLRCRGGVGTIGWPGAYGSWWQADPNEGSVLIFLAHNMVELHQMASGIGLGVWSAIAAFHAIGTA
jgi:CubicO group peptidase (beta-lactamase class C family)